LTGVFDGGLLGRKGFQEGKEKMQGFFIHFFDEMERLDLVNEKKLMEK